MTDVTIDLKHARLLRDAYLPSDPVTIAAADDTLKQAVRTFLAAIEAVDSPEALRQAIHDKARADSSSGIQADAKRNEAEIKHLAAILAQRAPREIAEHATTDAVLLRYLGRKVKAIAVDDCNYGETPRRVRQFDECVSQARTIASWYGLTVDDGGDPRGNVVTLHGQDMPSNSFGGGYGLV